MAVNDYVWKSGVSALSIEDKNTRLIFRQSNDDKIRMSCFENKFEHYEVEEGETLKIKKVFDYRWFHYLIPRMFHFEPTIVYLPKSFAGRLIARTTNGGVEGENLSAESLRVTTLNGKITVRNINVQGELRMRSANGVLQLAAAAANQMILETSNGGVRLDRVDVRNSLEIKTSNGSVNGEICGKREDFIVESRTVNGRNNLHSASRGTVSPYKRFTVETTNGSINIAFME